VLLPGPITIAPGVSVDIHTFIVAATCILVGLQSITFGMIARRYATRSGLLPPSSRYDTVLESITSEQLLLVAAVLGLLGISGFGWSLITWARAGFGALDYPLVMRILIASMTAIAAAIQLTLSAFLASLLDINTKA
jgi:hypothetical protein